MRRTLAIAAILLLLLPAAVRAGEEDGDRRIVFVPTDRLDTLMEKHGRGVMLDVEEYLDLWRAAQEGRLVPTTRPATDAVILGGTLEGTITDERADFTLTYRIRVLEPGIRRVAFPLENTGVLDAVADGKPALLSRDAKGGFLLLSGLGDHTVVVKGRLRVVRHDEVRGVRFRLPAAASLALDLNLAEGMEPAKESLAGTWRAEESDGRTRILGHVPPTAEFAFAFLPRREEGAKSPLLHVVARNLHRIGPRVLRGVSVREITVHRKPVREITVRVPDGVLVTQVAAAGLSEWNVVDSVVRLSFRAETSGTIPVAIEYERDLPGPGDLTVPEVFVVGAADQRGLTAVAFESGLRGRILSSEGYGRVPVPVPPKPQKGRPAPSPIDRLALTGSAAVYRYWSGNRSLTVRTELPEGSVDCTAAAALTLLEDQREFRVDFAYRPRGERVFEFAPILPAEFLIRSVKVTSNEAHTWERMEDGRLAIRFPSGVAPDTTVKVTVHMFLADDGWRDDGWTSKSVALPVPDPAISRGEVRGLLAVFADPAFELSDRDLAGLDPEPVERAGLPQARLAYLWRGTPGTGSLEVVRREPKVSVRHTAIVAPGDKTATYTGFLHYNIERAGLNRFRFTVSGGFGDRLHVKAPGNVEPRREPQEDGTDLWTVTLPRKVRGERLIRLDLEEELSAVEGGKAFVFPEVTVLDVEDETGYLAVESGHNAKLTLTAEGLLEIGLEEMAPVMERLGYRPARALLGAFQYATHPWSLTVLSAKYDEKEVLTAFVKSARLVTLVAEDGTLRTRATYRILSADRQFLEVQLPADSFLWGALVAGKAVKTSAGKGVVLVPLGSTSAESVIEVVLMLEGLADDLGNSGELELEAPVLRGVLGAEAEWEVWLPSGYRPTGADGVFGATFGPPPDPWLYRAFDELVDASRIEPTIYRGKPAAGAYWDGADSTAAPQTRARPGRKGRDDYARDSIEEPTIKDAKVSDHNESEKPAAPPEPEPQADPGAPMPTTPDVPPAPDDSGAGSGEGEESDADMPYEESLGEKDFISDAPFDGPSTNASIGVGGGAGGRFGGRGGRRQLTRIGRVGGLSLDVPLVPGGQRQVVSALGVRGGVRIAYVKSESHEAIGYSVSVLTAIVGLLLTGVLRRGGGVESRRIPPILFVVLTGAFATFAPAWFGARDLTIWDAVARGTFWAAIVMLGLWGYRRLAELFTPRRAGAAAVILLALIASAPAEAGPAPEKAGETVYVPFDPARVGELDGAGKVFLPFEKWKELWNAAHPERQLTSPQDAPVPWLLSAAGYEGAVEGETVKVTARYDLVVLAEGWVEVALSLSPAVVEQALVDGEPVRVRSKKGAHSLLLKGEGAHRVELTLRVLLRRDGGRRVVGLHLPPIPRTVFTLALPYADAEVTSTGPTEPEVVDGKAKVLLGPAGVLTLGFRKKTDTPKIASRVEVEGRQVLLADEGRVSARLRSEWRVVTGEISEVGFDLDPAWELVSVVGADVKAWAVEAGRLDVRLGRIVKDKTVIDVFVERVDGARSRTVSLPKIAPRGAVRERGLLAVSASPDLRVSLSGLRNLDRIGANPADFAGLLPAGSQLHSAWRYVLRPLGLTLTTEAVRAEVRVEIPVMHTIARELLLGRVGFFFEVHGDGTFEFPVRFPADLEIDSVEGAGLDRWWREDDVLTFSTSTPIRGKFQPTVKFRKRLDPDAVQVDIPEIHAIGVDRESGRVLVARSPEISLTVRADDGLVKENVSIYGSWAKILPQQVNAYGYRQDGEAYRLAVARSFPVARVRPVTTTHLQVEDDQVVVSVHVFFAIENAGQDTFRVFLPEGEGEDPIIVAERRRRLSIDPFEEEGRRGKLLTLELQQPAIGRYEFRIVYEKKLDTSGGDLRKGKVTVAGLEPEGENAASYVYGVNLSRGEVFFTSPEGLDESDPDQFPFMPPEFLPNGADRDLILAAFSGRTASWSVPVDITIRSFADFPDALVTSAEMLTAVGRDGWTRNRMTYRVLNRTRQFLEISLPDGSTFEAARVGGEAVKPGRRKVGGEWRIMIPLARMQAGDISTDVELFWSRRLGKGEDLAALGRLSLMEPKIHGLDVEKTFFTVCFPTGYELTFDGNMDRIEEAAQTLYRAQQRVEELKRVVEVQTEGGESQKSRADENYLRARIDLKNEISSLSGRLSDAEDKAELSKLNREFAELEETARDNFGNRGGNRAAAQRGREASQQELADLTVRNSELAKKQLDQQYRYKGKSNVAQRGFAANPNADQGLAGPPTNAAIGQQAQTLTVIPQATTTELRAEWRAAFEDLQRAATPQTDGVRFGGTQFGLSTLPRPGDADATRRPNLRPAGSESDSDRPVSWAARRQPAARAGLLSLAVTVPRRGQVFRFEKLNGGARLDVSVGKPGTGRGVGGFLLFALVVAVLIVFYRVRPQRKIPYFWPGVLVILAILAGAFLEAHLLTIAGLAAAAVWAVAEFRERRALARTI